MGTSEYKLTGLENAIPLRWSPISTDKLEHKLVTPSIRALGQCAIRLHLVIGLSFRWNLTLPGIT